MFIQQQQIRRVPLSLQPAQLQPGLEEAPPRLAAGQPLLGWAAPLHSLLLQV